MNWQNSRNGQFKITSALLFLRCGQFMITLVLYSFLGVVVHNENLNICVAAVRGMKWSNKQVSSMNWLHEEQGNAGVIVSSCDARDLRVFLRCCWFVMTRKELHLTWFVSDLWNSACGKVLLGTCCAGICGGLDGYSQDSGTEFRVWSTGHHGQTSG